MHIKPTSNTSSGSNLCSIHGTNLITDSARNRYLGTQINTWTRVNVLLPGSKSLLEIVSHRRASLESFIMDMLVFLSKKPVATQFFSSRIDCFTDFSKLWRLHSYNYIHYSAVQVRQYDPNIKWCLLSVACTLYYDFLHSFIYPLLP